jgi:hypothetical protein
MSRSGRFVMRLLPPVQGAPSFSLGRVLFAVSLLPVATVAALFGLFLLTALLLVMVAALVFGIWIWGERRRMRRSARESCIDAEFVDIPDTRIGLTRRDGSVDRTRL